MKYGAVEDSRLEVPPSEPVMWIGYDKTKVNGSRVTSQIMAKTWFVARAEIAKRLHPSSLDNLVVVRSVVGQDTNDNNLGA